jgi:hypothetical protein
MARRTLATLAVVALSACTQSAPLAITTWGEDYIEKELPADVFADAWQVQYSKFLVVFSSIEVADAADNVAGAMKDPIVMDLTQKGPTEIAQLGEVPAQRWDAITVLVKPEEVPQAGSASETDATLMGDNGFSVYVEGTATKGSDSATFAFGFDTATEFHDCETEGEGAGVVVRAGEQNTMQLTIHGDHLFYDDLASPDAAVRFDAVFAADGADGTEPDGAIDVAELGAVDLTTLPTDQYGNAGTAESLFDFMNELSRTVVHMNGEGECSITAR